LLIDFSLQIDRQEDNISIIGSERDKRKLIYYLLSIENDNNFIAFTENGLSLELTHQQNLRETIGVIFDQNKFHINDFGLNNLLIHLLVIVDRIQKGKQISETVPLDKIENSTFFQISRELKDLIESQYGINISDAELYYLTLIIASNSNPQNYALITPENISDYIDDHYIFTTQKSIKRLEEVYFLDPFDNTFLVNLTIHIENMVQRARNNLYMKNPLTVNIKTSYPLIYDMAVFLAREICNFEKITISEDEITFIAFYLGAYLEKQKSKVDKISCTYIFAKYHDFHQPALAHLQEIFKDDLVFSKVISINEINIAEIQNDIVISTVDIPLNTTARIIRINIFPTNQDIELIKKEINVMKQKRKKESVIKSIEHFIGKELFRREFYQKDEFEMINALSNECQKLGLCESTFVDEVIERENLSSTSFSNFVAVPHSLNHNALRSFMSVVINRQSMQWGNNSVNIIILIGIAKEDRSIFREIFNDLIIILCEPIYVNQIIKCNDYDSFIETITPMLAKQAAERE
jgi:lichenan operon transcriptional antiterminator